MKKKNAWSASAWRKRPFKIKYPPPAETRRLGRLMDTAQRDEQIIVNELVSEFLQDDLSKNEAYHQAKEDFVNGWQNILALLDIA